MVFYFTELENVLLVVLAVFAFVMHSILFLLGFAAIVALACRVARFVLVDLSPGKRKLVLVALAVIDIALVIAGIVATVSLLH